MAAVVLLTGCSGKGATNGASASDASKTSGDGTSAATGEVVTEGSIKLGEYKGIPVSVTKAEVTEEELEAQIQQILSTNAELVEVDRAAKNGDTVNIDYIGKLDGEVFDGGTAQGFDLELGSNSFIDGFEAGLVGVKKGDKKDLNLSFPEEYSNSPDLAGKAVVFEVTVNSVKEEQIPELNDGFVLKTAPKDLNVENYKKRLKDDMLKQKEYQIESDRNFAIVNTIMESSEIVCATADVDEAYNSQLEMFTSEAAAYGMDFATYSSMYGMDEASFQNEIRLMAEDITKQKMMFTEIAKIENITVTDEDLEELAKKNNKPDAAALIEQYGQEEVDNAAFSQKVMSFLVENATITVTEGVE